MIEAATAAALVIGLVFVDALCIPRPPARLLPRSRAGTLVLLSAGAVLSGLLLAVTGSPVTAAMLTLLLAATLTLISNVKHRVLGEPLVFSDFALVIAVFQQPQFYVSALKRWQIVLLVGVVMALVGCVIAFSSGALWPRVGGLGLALVGCAALTILLQRAVWQPLTRAPDLLHDVGRHGLVATTLAYWFHWRARPDPPECDLPPVVAHGDPLVVIIQCESFTDPVDLFGDPSLALPGLAAARAMAGQAGRLEVPGFGAYTMRTEYGVLFGRSEEQLGLRRFDPFLTAQGEASWALPRRLEQGVWKSLFLHPHDLRFYGRNRVMREAGFNQIVGADGFAPPAVSEGRYVTDAAVGDTIMEIASKAAGPTLMYVVTIENHGPWAAPGEGDAHDGAAYLELLRHSDAMLLRLVEELPRIGRPVTLCFFGDHRPSIPKASEPGGERHTPYVIASFGPDGTPQAPGTDTTDLTPAALHHSILAAIGDSRALER